LLATARIALSSSTVVAISKDRLFAADITKQDRPDTSINSDDATYIENDPLYGIDISGWEGSGYTDEEIAQNNADLGDFPG
jgi:hypothetical protein